MTERNRNVIVWGPTKIKAGTVEETIGVEIEILRDEIVDPTLYSLQMQPYLLMLCNMYDEAHQAAESTGDWEAVKKLGVLIFEEAKISPAKVAFKSRFRAPKKRFIR